MFEFKFYPYITEFRIMGNGLKDNMFILRWHHFVCTMQLLQLFGGGIGSFHFTVALLMRRNLYAIGLSGRTATVGAFFLQLMVSFLNDRAGKFVKQEVCSAEFSGL